MGTRMSNVVDMKPFMKAKQLSQAAEEDPVVLEDGYLVLK
jgi:hypothetical protein